MIVRITPSFFDLSDYVSCSVVSTKYSVTSLICSGQNCSFKMCSLSLKNWGSLVYDHDLKTQEAIRASSLILDKFLTRYTCTYTCVVFEMSSPDYPSIYPQLRISLHVTYSLMLMWRLKRTYDNWYGFLSSSLKLLLCDIIAALKNDYFLTWANVELLKLVFSKLSQ